MSRIKKLVNNSNLCPRCGKGLLVSKFRQNFSYCPAYKQCEFKGKKLLDMSKAKNITIKPLLTASEEQKAIFKWAETSNNHAIIEALAGTGKTTVLVQLVRIFAERKLNTLCVAFSRRDKLSLEERVGQHAKVFTNNGAGLGILSSELRNSGFKLNVSNSVGYELLRKLWEEDGLIPKDKEAKWLAPASVFNTILNIVDKVRTTVPLSSTGKKLPTDDDFADICERFGIELKYEHMQQAFHYSSALFLKLSQLGTAWAHGVDFAGQLFLPVYYGLHAKVKYDRILVDECQDQNYYTRELVKSYLAPGGAIIGVGDVFQAIYGWRGADSDSIKNLNDMLSETGKAVDKFPLTLCRRCPELVVYQAKQLVPHIKGLGKNKGIIEELSDEKFLHKLLKDKKGWVICRANAPNVSLCLQLLANGVKAMLSRSNLVSELINLIDTCSDSTGDDCDIVTLMQGLDEWLFDKRQKLVEQPNGGKRLQAAEDKVACIKAMCEATNIKKTKDIKDTIDKLFPTDTQPDPDEMVVFSTVHGSKGGEAKNVYLYSPQSSKGSLWDQIWGNDPKDRDNVLYVAITRSEEYLCYAGMTPTLKRLSS